MRWRSITIELKAVEFEPEFVGKLSFYLSAFDDQLRTEHNNPTIGHSICRKRDKLMAEDALCDVNKPIGISEYRISESLPDELKSTLPTIAEIEDRLGNEGID